MLSRTKAKKLCRQFFIKNNITDKLHITRTKKAGSNVCDWTVNGITVGSEFLEAFEIYRKDFIRTGKLIED